MIVHDYLGCVAWQYKLTTLRLFGTGAYTGFELQQAGGAVTGAHHVRRDIPASEVGLAELSSSIHGSFYSIERK